MKKFECGKPDPTEKRKNFGRIEERNNGRTFEQSVIDYYIDHCNNQVSNGQ